ncbi:MAG: hypothetical protein KatS3mg092_0352 [Patescibacteria group bacterium]|nr:MAG: hypothetical protein KatS3mg092_0352 [Patescibacteria group bacterium]
MIISTISSKNQITLPKDILLSIGIGPKDKLLIRKEEEKIILSPLKNSVVDEIAGVLTKNVSRKKLNQPLTEIRKQTKIKTAYKLMKKNE